MILWYRRLSYMYSFTYLNVWKYIGKNYFNNFERKEMTILVWFSPVSSKMEAMHYRAAYTEIFDKFKYLWFLCSVDLRKCITNELSIFTFKIWKHNNILWTWITYTWPRKQMKITVVLVKKYSKYFIIDENYHGWNIVDTV